MCDEAPNALLYDIDLLALALHIEIFARILFERGVIIQLLEKYTIALNGRGIAVTLGTQARNLGGGTHHRHSRTSNND